MPRTKLVDKQSNLHRFWRRQNTTPFATDEHSDGTSDENIREDESAPDPTTTPEESTAQQLSPEQQELLANAIQGQNIFYTGSAGTGKSFLLHKMITALQISSPKGTVAVTASTGAAACNIGGVTLHSFAGIGLGTDTCEVLVKKIRHNKKTLARWKTVKALVIDEVSMIEAPLFDKLSHIARTLRKKQSAFGGIQIIATGDFLQLPPVSFTGSPKYAFEAESWNDTFSKITTLRTIFRQQDVEFTSMLNELRFGIVSDACQDYIKALERPLHYTDGPEPTALFARRHDVEKANTSALNKLHSPIREFVAIDGGSIADTSVRSRVLQGLVTPKRLVLRIGAQVMLVRNHDKELVNGSIGVVTGFNHAPTDEGDTTTEYPSVAFTFPDGRIREHIVQPHTFTLELPSGEVQAFRIQIPLILAWAVSIHKAQGKSLERVTVNLNKVFENGQVYVALSRAVGTEGLQVLNFRRDKVRASPRAIHWYRDMDLVNEQTA